MGATAIENATRPGDPTLLGISDPRGFVSHALNDELRSRGASLDEDKFEDCVSYLLEDLCRLAQRYDPNKGSSFSKFAYRITRFRYTSYLRASRGDSRYGMDGREVATDDVEGFGLASEDELDLLAIIDELDHDGLSPNARGTLRELASRVANGLNLTEAAADLSINRREAAEDLKRLRLELSS